MEKVTSQNPKLLTHQASKSNCSKSTRNSNINFRTPLKIYRQNVRGLRCKTNELISHLHPNPPQIFCLTEHHDYWEELQQIALNDYNLATYAKGGAHIYVHKSLNFEGVDIGNYCKEKDLEACAIKLNLNSTHICIISIYRTPTGNFNFFTNNLDLIFNKLHNPTSKPIIICGDINIDYLKNTRKKNKLQTLLLSYNLISTVNFPTRCFKNSATATDNIFIDIDSKNDYTLCPIMNGLSDHDAQLLFLNTITLRPPAQYNKLIRTLDKDSLNDFLNK